jgi:hypothetical protein
LGFGDPDAGLSQARSKQSLIQWPTEQQIQHVAKQLAKIEQVGIRSEAKGDYFKSGELAYQIFEIIRTTAELFKKSQRVKE